MAGRLNELVAAVELEVNETSEVMGRLARADLGARMTRQTSGALLRLQQDVNAVVGSFCDIVGELRGTSTELRGASSKITASSKELARRIAEQRDVASRTSGIVREVVAAVLASADASAQSCAEQVEKTKLAIDWTDEQTQNLDRLVDRFSTGEQCGRKRAAG